MLLSKLYRGTGCMSWQKTLTLYIIKYILVFVITYNLHDIDCSIVRQRVNMELEKNCFYLYVCKF